MLLWARLTRCVYSCKITLTACNPALLHVASTAARWAEGGSNLGRCGPALYSPISAPSRWEHRAHRLVLRLPVGWGEGLPAWVNREAVNESGEGIICLSVLLPCLALRSRCREMEKMRRNPHPTPPPPVIFLSGRKCPQILKHGDSTGLYSLWTKMMRRCLGDNL